MIIKYNGNKTRKIVKIFRYSGLQGAFAQA
ncbi:DNA-directed RNA polymerase subunit H (RpoH/RPB5) [Limibacillus halophilus]|uniref:DNA-directed RNA polymerase subunit H (RpoH/RPB5) n=1 Tax=Limibacillus halophilus TaxID=1579333 RepID=A0A839SWX1_9PROT|nr:DNA-directed RNA polymerase subunit H (RpoH/RPB5) [Limibacillus halophilus]